MSARTTVFLVPRRKLPRAFAEPGGEGARFPMPHRLSLVRRLAQLRRMYTGETDSSLMPAVVAGVQKISADDRVRLHEILDNDNVGRLFGDDELAPLPSHV